MNQSNYQGAMAGTANAGLAVVAPLSENLRDAYCTAQRVQNALNELHARLYGHHPVALGEAVVKDFDQDVPSNAASSAIFLRNLLSSIEGQTGELLSRL